MLTAFPPNPARGGTPRRRRTLRRLSGIWIGGVLLLGTGCVTREAVVVEEVLLPIAAPRPWLPSASDLAAADLARSALASTPLPGERSSAEHASGEKGSGERTTHGTAAAAQASSQKIEAALAQLEREASSEDQKRLVPLARDLRNAALDDPIAYREASRRLRKRRGLDPRLANRLDRTIGDDPIRLARRRQLDDWEELWARTFNSVSEPLGSSAITGFTIAPFQLANSLVHYLASFSNREPISSFGRQGLVLRKQFLAAHPETELTEQLERRIERDEIRLEKTLALRYARAAEDAVKQGRAGAAAYQSEAALRLLENHPDQNQRTRKRVRRVASAAAKQIESARAARARAIDARAVQDETLAAADADFAAALFAPSFDFDRARGEAEAYARAGGSKDRAEFVRALLQFEGGFEKEAEGRLAEIARAGPDDSAMSRHARHLLEDDWQNPYQAFERLRRSGARDELAFRLAGEWVNRPRYPNLPAPLAYLIDTPQIAITLILAPVRALLSPWTGGPDFERAAALAGYRYLGRFPEGARQHEVVRWLFDYEKRKERPGRALRLADLISELSEEERTELVELTASARLESAVKLDRRDTRSSVLKGVAREFPDSKPGQDAGLRARSEAEDASPQHIQMTRGFLLENPEIAGREGIGLNPILLNDDPRDGELHPDGVVLRGGRTLEIRLIAEGEDEEALPEPRWKKIGPQRLEQIAASLEASVHRNSLVDLDARQAPDAKRDVYLERAGFGLTEETDARPTAESNFVYRSVRERYGLVRGRDSVLPFDLVFRGSLGDFSLGAFPRWRAPKRTPDAFLYR